MAEYTRGPWELDESLRGNSYTAISGEDWIELATVVTRMQSGTEDSPEGLANARLIAAAPELLEALELARDHLEVCNHEGEEDEALAQINAAITKAKGADDVTA